MSVRFYAYKIFFVRGNNTLGKIRKYSGKTVSPTSRFDAFLRDKMQWNLKLIQDCHIGYIFA